LPVDFLKLLGSTLLLALVLTPAYLMFSGFKHDAKAAPARTMLGCVALMFFLLFVGGGFYPSFLMESSLRLFNPAWLATLLSTWSLGGALAPSNLALFVVPLFFCSGLCYVEWRRSL
jgi:hypothetical protein